MQVEFCTVESDRSLRIAMPDPSAFMDFGPEYQRFGVNGVDVRYEGPPTIDAAHDLAHIVVGLNGNGMLWISPEREPIRSKRCEFNVITLEHFMFNLFQHGPDEALERTEAYMLNFADTTYAPFPDDPGESLERFFSRIDPVGVANHAPLFLFLLSNRSAARVYGALSGDDIRCDDTTAGFSCAAHKLLSERRSNALEYFSLQGGAV